MAEELVNGVKWMALAGAIVCTTGMLNQRVEDIGITIGCSIVAASLFACFTVLHLHDLRSRDDK